VSQKNCIAILFLVATTATSKMMLKVTTTQRNCTAILLLVATAATTTTAMMLKDFRFIF